MKLMMPIYNANIYVGEGDGVISVWSSLVWVTDSEIVRIQFALRQIVNVDASCTLMLLLCLDRNLTGMLYLLLIA